MNKTVARHQFADSDVVARGLGAAGMIAIGLIHLLDAPGKFHETPYMGWLYVALIVASICTAHVLTLGSSSRAWLAAAGLAATAIIGFTLTRTTGLPQATGDIGNWTEPIGLASLYIEGAVVALSAVTLLRRRAATNGPEPPERAACAPVPE